jgi:large subunit ribosomal protein L54
MICTRCLLRARPRALGNAFQLAEQSPLASALARRNYADQKSDAPRQSTTSSATVLSTVPAGTPLKGLNFLKNKQDPVAMEDAEYPAWLWTLLKSEKAGNAETNLEADLYGKLSYRP